MVRTAFTGPPSNVPRFPLRIGYRIWWNPWTKAWSQLPRCKARPHGEVLFSKCSNLFIGKMTFSPIGSREYSFFRQSNLTEWKLDSFHLAIWMISSGFMLQGCLHLGDSDLNNRIWGFDFARFYCVLLFSRPNFRKPSKKGSERVNWEWRRSRKPNVTYQILVWNQALTHQNIRHPKCRWPIRRMVLGRSSNTSLLGSTVPGSRYITLYNHNYRGYISTRDLIFHHTEFWRLQLHPGATARLGHWSQGVLREAKMIGEGRPALLWALGAWFLGQI